MATMAQLRAFHALAIEGSFQGAADKLYLTQPAISIQIRNLERDSERVLLRRSGHNFSLTEDGKALLEMVTQIHTLEARSAEFLAPDNGSQKQPVVLGADGPHVALDLIAVCQRLYPNLQFEIVLANAETTWANLLALNVDIAVMANPPDDPRVNARKISLQSLQAWVPRSNQICKLKEVSLEQICAFPLIFRENGSNTQRILERALQELKLSPQIAMRIGSREGMREAVSRGMGIGFGFDRELGNEPAFEGIPIIRYEHTNTDMLLCRQDFNNSTTMKQIVQALAALKSQQRREAGGDLDPKFGKRANSGTHIN